MVGCVEGVIAILEPVKSLCLKQNSVSFAYEIHPCGKHSND